MLFTSIKRLQLLRPYLYFHQKTKTTIEYMGKKIQTATNMIHICEMTIYRNLFYMDFWRGNLGSFLLKINVLMQNETKPQNVILFPGQG